MTKCDHCGYYGVLNHECIGSLRAGRAEFIQAAVRDGETIAKLREDLARVERERDEYKTFRNQLWAERDAAIAERDALRTELAALKTTGEPVAGCICRGEHQDEWMACRVCSATRDVRPGSVDVDGLDNRSSEAPSRGCVTPVTPAPAVEAVPVAWMVTDADGREYACVSKLSADGWARRHGSTVSALFRAPPVAEAGAKREVTGRVVRLGRVSYLQKVSESPSRFGITTDRHRAHRFLDDVRFVRLVRRGT